MSVLVIGAGGHAKVVIATLRAAGLAVAGVLDDDAAKHGRMVLGVPVVGAVERAAEGDHEAVIAVGHNATRKRISESLPGLRWATVVHPSAVVHETVRLGAGTVVFAGAVVQPDTRLGAHTIINTGASADHDNDLGDYVHLAPGVRLAGDVTLEEGVFMGIASAALPGVRIGAWTTVGAGGVVTRDLPGGVTAVGVPARPLSS